MTTLTAAILLVVALALIVSAGIALPRRRQAEGGLNHTSAEAHEVESELLRRPLRSHYGG